MGSTSVGKADGGLGPAPPAAPPASRWPQMLQGSPPSYYTYVLDVLQREERLIRVTVLSIENVSTARTNQLLF